MHIPTLLHITCKTLDTWKMLGCYYQTPILMTICYCKHQPFLTNHQPTRWSKWYQHLVVFSRLSIVGLYSLQYQRLTSQLLQCSPALTLPVRRAPRPKIHSRAVVTTAIVTNSAESDGGLLTRASFISYEVWEVRL